MYPLHQNKEKCFQISFNNPHQPEIPEDLILRPASGELDHSNGVKNLGKSRSRKFPKSVDNLHGNHDSDENHKNKTMHRERERQRRQEMGTLCTNLRTLLPLEFIKGNRAISDQMNGAVNYIKHQKKRINEMEVKRDELRKLQSCSSFGIGKSCASSTPSCSFKIISSIHGVLEIVITATGFNGFPLSRILGVLVEEELDIVSCGSSTANGKSIHTIQIELTDSSSVHLSQLAKRLTEAVPMMRQITD